MLEFGPADGSNIVSCKQLEMKSNFPLNFTRQIDALEPSSNVAVITFVGSLCPVTRAHVLCVEEARKVVLDEQSEFSGTSSRPKFVVAVISVNGDYYVQSKLRKRGEPAISAEKRRFLVDLATQEFDWICSHQNAWRAVQELRKIYPHLCFCQYELDGADVAFKNKVWTSCTQDHKRIVMGRACESGEFDPTQKIIEFMQQGTIPSANFMLGPILPDISSTRVRDALRTQDIVALREMLCPRVLEWLLANSPYSSNEMMRSMA